MLVLNLNDQLGNQLFSYASIKSVCLKRGIKFGWYISKSLLINSTDEKYGNTFEQLFEIDLSERINEEQTSSWNNWREPWPRADTNFLPHIYSIPENTVVYGHFQTPKYFDEYKKDVIKWYTFKTSIKVIAEQRFLDIRRNYDKKTIFVGIHIRIGNDYLRENRNLAHSYYRNAVRWMNEYFIGSEVVFILFSDCIRKAQKILKGSKVEIAKGSLFADLCLMTLCDANIVSNSTFSWWGAWLNKNCAVTLRPSVYPISNNDYYPLDIFPSDWKSIPASRGRKYPVYHYYHLRTKIKKCLKA